MGGVVSGRRYAPSCTGFVIEWVDAINVKDPARPSISYWYGSDHVWGTTWGGLDLAAVYASRPAARRAYESVRSWALKATGVSIVRVSDVEARDARLEPYLSDPEGHAGPPDLDESPFDDAENR